MRVALEVAELFVQLVGFDAVQGVGAGGGDDRVDVAGIQFAEAAGQPLGRVGGDEGQVVREVVQVLAGVLDVHDVGGVRVEGLGHGPDPGGAVAEGDDLAEVVPAAAQVLGLDEASEGVLAVGCGHVAGRAGIHHRPAVIIQAGHGEEPGELDPCKVSAPGGAAVRP